MTQDALPIDDVLAELCATLRGSANTVLEAPPGAGKTTRVPLALWQEPWATGRIIMLEPRRLAARAAARRMAESLGEEVGRRIGFRTRGETRVSRQTRIEVVTEGILTRMAIADPALEGVACVIFDEIHERNLNTDLALAMCLELQAALRPDLKLLAMSATLDAAPIAALMHNAPVIRASGLQHDVETRWAESALPDRRPATLASAAADTVLDTLNEAPGDILVFLPGAGEINRAASLLRETVPPGIEIHRLFAAASQREQRAALASGDRRRVVLSSAIAETSLTVPGVRVVVDAGAARRARFDPASGMSRLVTDRVSRAEADQRRGRAGREAAGLCLRLWTRGEHGALASFAPPEITIADLAPLVLDCAAWGSRPEALPFLDPPPTGALVSARRLLTLLGALDDEGRITAAGRRMAQIPVHPRLAAMILHAGDVEPTAHLLAALLSEGDPARDSGADVVERMNWLTGRVAPPAGLSASLEAVRRTARRLGAIEHCQPDAVAPLLARAYPDRIAQRRKGSAPRWVMSGGKGAFLPPGDILADAPYLVVADLDGDAREARIRLAAQLDRATLDETLEHQIETVPVIAWDERAASVLAQQETRLGSLVLSTRPLEQADGAAVQAAMIEGIRRMGLSALPWSAPAGGLRARMLWARQSGAMPDAPNWSDEVLLATLETWLRPWLAGMSRKTDLASLDLAAALRTAAAAELQTLDRVAPADLATPTGRTIRIDYAAADPTIRLRPQTIYGLDEHPRIGGRPLVVELLSPADRPIARTADLPSFWRQGWTDVRKDMRGRYPRHDWPEEPWRATPTVRTRARH